MLFAKIPKITTNIGMARLAIKVARLFQFRLKQYFIIFRISLDKRLLFEVLCCKESEYYPYNKECRAHPQKNSVIFHVQAKYYAFIYPCQRRQIDDK